MVFRAEQGIDFGKRQRGVVVAREFFGSAAEHALDTRTGKVGQAVGREEGEAVFHRVFEAKAGGERSSGARFDDVASVVG